MPAVSFHAGISDDETWYTLMAAGFRFQVSGFRFDLQQD